MKKMKRKTIIASVFILSVIALSQLSSGNIVTNPGFETEEVIHGIPTTFGDWGGNLSHVVTDENGIIPHSGNRMMRFDQTANGSWATPYQFINLALRKANNTRHYHINTSMY